MKRCDAIAVLGAGRSGQAVAALAARSGCEVFVSDVNRLSLAQKQQLERLGVKWEEEGHSRRLFEFPVWVLSPGVSRFTPLVQQAEAYGIAVYGELEFALQFVPPTMTLIGITGTNGKTTTAHLLHHIVTMAGYPAVLAGNVGIPLAQVVDNLDANTILILELSSYQLEQNAPLELDIAIWLNFSPDHLAYHQSLQQYFYAKAKIACLLTARNLLILNSDETTVRAVERWSAARTLFFGRYPVQRGIAFTEQQLIWVQQHKEEELMNRQELSLLGVHNVYNSMAAALAARALEISNEDIRDSLMSFVGVEHRLEYVDTVEEVLYYNDSKATNVNAAWYALQSFDRPIVWIAGGQHSTQSYRALDTVVRQKVRALVALGEEADRLVQHFGFVPSYVVRSLAEAVALAHCLASPEDVVLFSPACKSFDMFANFEHRGQEFKRAVKTLKEQLDNR